MIKNGFSNIQIVAKNEMKIEFEDIFQQSGANSKGEFIRILLDNYLQPETLVNKSKAENQAKFDSLRQQIATMEQQNHETNQSLQTTQTELQQAKETESFYEKSLQPFYEKINGKELTVGNRKIVVNSVKDIFTIMVQSFKIKE